MQNKMRDAFKHFSIDRITGLIKVDQYITKTYFKTFAPAAPIVSDVNLYVTSTNMALTTYTIATPSPSDALCRNVCVAVSTVGGVADTMGTVLVTGTDYNDEVITETITPVSGARVEGKKAFKTVTAAISSGWVRDGAGGTEDTIEIGCGSNIGMPEIVESKDILFTVWNQVSSATLPTFAFGPTVSDCTVTLPEAGNSAKKLIVYYTKYTGH